MDLEPDETYLHPFKTKNWRIAVESNEVYSFINDYFANLIYWHEAFPTGASEVVLNNMVPRFKAFSALSKLEVYLFFPYMPYHAQEAFHNQITKIAQRLFTDVDGYVVSLTKEGRLVCLNSDSGEEMLIRKSKQIDIIKNSNDMKETLPPEYMEAVGKISDGFHEMLHQLQYDREQMKAVGGLGKEASSHKLSNASQRTPFSIPDKTVKLLSYNKNAVWKHGLPGLPKNGLVTGKNNTQQETATTVENNDVSLARIMEIMKNVAEEHAASLAAELTDHHGNDPALARRSFSQLEKLDPKHPEYKQPQQSNRRKRLTTDHTVSSANVTSSPEIIIIEDDSLTMPLKRERVTEKRIFNKPEMTVKPSVETQDTLAPVEISKKSMPTLPVQETKLARTINQNSQANSSDKKRAIFFQRPSTTRQISSAKPTAGNNEGPSYGSPKKITVRRVDAPKAIRVTSGKHAIVQPSRKVDHFIIPQKIPMKSHYVERVMNTNDGKQMNFVEKVTPIKVIGNGGVKIVFHRSSQIRNTTIDCVQHLTPPRNVGTPQKSARPIRCTVVPSPRKVVPIRTTFPSTKFGQPANPLPTVKSVGDSRTPQKVALHRIESAKTSETLSFAKEPTIRDASIATVQPFLPENNLPTETQFEKNIIHPVHYQKAHIPFKVSEVEVPASKDFTERLQIPTENPESKFFNFDNMEIVDHEEVVTTSEDELFQLLEETERKEQAEHNNIVDTRQQQTLEENVVFDDQFSDEYPDIIDEGTVLLEEIPDDGEILFEEPKEDDLFFSAEEIEGLLTPKRVALSVSNSLTYVENARLEAAYPDLFVNTTINGEQRHMMACFLLNRPNNPPNSHSVTVKVNETYRQIEPKQKIELFFEMNYQTMVGKRIQKTQTYWNDGVQEVVDYLDGPQNRTEVMHRYEHAQY